MAFRLRSLTAWPPGGWRYRQIETSWGVEEMDFVSTAVAIASHRKANRLSRSTVKESAEDLEAYTIKRLNNDPAWVKSSDTDSTAGTSNPPTVKGCATCGARKKA